ncbi:MAG TPA: four-carbon acid sugar kinase family protein [Candidatus Scatomonas pullistercoris]|uniref:Four-carbon acid sugar kinase family protein n=1 Tax=Candidatus Scatomonas pullistercoris TaxID=2840920 RepID=A0A9D1P2A0_9FIRM|nr:four-carbon acid sugar kinase family protein [Candidatus Scatomonas pullistercoris]
MILQVLWIQGFNLRVSGIEVYVLLELKSMELPECAVMIYDAETRHKSPQEAYSLIKKTVQWARKNGIAGIYKKTDSALRGNVGIELQALLENWEDDNLIFAPAYPEMKRFTRKGIQLIDGIPVAESVFGKDLFEPVRHSSVAEIIHETSNVKTYETDKNALETLEKRKGILIADADTYSDLDQIAKWSMKHGVRSYAGCAGFARALAGNVYKNGKKNEIRSMSPVLLAVCGSIHPATVRQVTSAGQKGMERISLKKKMLLDLEKFDKEELCRCAKHWAAICSEKKALILDVEQEENAAGADMGEISRGEKIADGLAMVTKQILDSGIYPTLFCTGGDTLRAVVKSLGLTAMRPMAELFPGVVLNQAMVPVV